jgi:hypothetical protein
VSNIVISGSRWLLERHDAGTRGEPAAGVE